MTKAEELKLLAQIETLIKKAGDDSYIAMTFEGIVNICKSNIENDFGDAPVRDLEEARKLAEDRMALAETISGKLESLEEDFAKLEDAYRAAVKATEAARPYAVAEYGRLKSELINVDSDSDDAKTLETVRAYRKAGRAAALTFEVEQAAHSKPLCYTMDREVG